MFRALARREKRWLLSCRGFANMPLSATFVFCVAIRKQVWRWGSMNWAFSWAMPICISYRWLQERGNRGLGKIIAGVFLVGAAFFMPASLTGAGFLGTTVGGAMKGLGVALALGGLGQMLSPAPKMSGKAEDQSSYLFNGGENVTTEGGPVPLVYGHKFRVSPVLIAAGLSSEDIAI